MLQFISRVVNQSSPFQPLQISLHDCDILNLLQFLLPFWLERKVLRLFFLAQNNFIAFMFETCLTGYKLFADYRLFRQLFNNSEALIENFGLLCFSEITLCVQMWKTVMNDNTVLQRYVAEKLQKEAQHSLPVPPR